MSWSTGKQPGGQECTAREGVAAAPHEGSQRFLQGSGTCLG